MAGFKSGLAPHLEAYVRHRRAAGRWNDTYMEGLLAFDRHVCERFAGERGLTQEMVDTWGARRETELPSSTRSRAYAAIGFFRFMRERGLADVHDPELPKGKNPAFVPHPFAEEEIAGLFAACDEYVLGLGRGKIGLRARRALPVLLRLLYSSGIRTGEARLLERGDVDLERGVLTITKGKGKNERVVALHPSMLPLMRRYDELAEELDPGRRHFFARDRDSHYSGGWLSGHFRGIWARVGEAGVRAYDLRHHYCTANINSLLNKGLSALEDLEDLSKSMGHASPEETAKNYYHLVPAMSKLLLEQTGDSFDEIVPEVV